MTEPSVNIRLSCGDLGEALKAYTDELGFRLDMIFPADSPRQVRLSGYGLTLTLEPGSTPIPDQAQTTAAGVMIQRASDAWGEGRAGMQYRDLIPGRLGGHFIASHIRISEGGPVADYVHHHHVRFQMIYCYRGWVRVVYEDQGEPFSMHAGDCVLQPPHIRHQVLASSDGMEVIEIGCPAEHETLLDHELHLPNPTVNPDRVFDGQKFVYHRCSDANWLSSPRGDFDVRDTGIAAATNRLASAVVLRPNHARDVQLSSGGQELHFMFVLSGSLSLVKPDGSESALEAGDCFAVPPDSRYALSNPSTDLELLQVLVGGTRRGSITGL